MWHISAFREQSAEENKIGKEKRKFYGVSVFLYGKKGKVMIH